MDSYIGAKIINAKLSNLKEYKIEKYGENSAIINEDDEKIEGYIVVYPPLGTMNETPYISWSPKEVFEICYRKIENAEKGSMLSSPFED